METIVQALQNFFSEYVVALAVLIVAAVWGIWKLASAIQSMRDKVKGIDDLPCANHANKIEKHDERIADTCALMSKMEGQLELLVKNSIEKNNVKIKKKAGYAFSAKHSPRHLNQNGIELLSDCGGDKVLNVNMDFFIAKIEKLQPKTALDVEDIALAVLQTSTNEDMFIPLKSWVYNAPAREIKDADGSVKLQEIDLDDVIFVMSLPLRDRYLELHPEIIK